MNKAVPWNVNGVGFDAREAARDAARRQGKSLGEWLHGVIADHASGMGVAEADMGDPQRIDAVTSKLERLSARSVEHDRHVGRDRLDRQGRTDARSSRDTVSNLRDHGDAQARRQRPDLDDDDSDENDRPRRRRRERAPSDAAEYLLEEAIDAMERRQQRAERRTDKALQSVAELLQRNETNRDRERNSVSALARQLSDIETRLSDRFTQTDDNPVKSALARLEARLDTIGRRSAAEALARRQTQDGRRPDRASEETGSIQRLEDKLNTIIEAVHGRSPKPAPEASPIAMAASQVAVDRGRLGTAIADITRRQQTLEDDAPTVSLREAILRRGGTSTRHREPARQAYTNEESTHREPRRTDHSRHAAPEVSAFAEMQGEIGLLATKIEDLRRDIVAERRGKAQAFVDLARQDLERNDLGRTGLGRQDDLGVELRRRIGSLQEDLVAVGEKIDDLRAPGVEPAAVANIQDQMQEIRDLIAANAAGPGAVERIETRIADLGDRLDRRSRFAGPRDLDASFDEPRASNTGASDALAKIEGRLEDLAAKVDAAVATGARRGPTAWSAQAGTDVATLETLVRDLGRKMEAVQAPNAGQDAFDALQSQIAALSARFEQSNNGLAKLGSLERAMRDLFVHLEETRSSVETSAQRAAREVLRIAVEDGRAHTEKGTATSLATMQTLQEEADARTNATLSAVHETLEKVVDRLSLMETDIAEVRSRPAPAAGRPASAKPPAAAMPTMPASPKPASAKPASAKPAPARPRDVSLGAAEPFLDSMLGHRPGAAAVPPAAAKPTIKVDIDDDQRRASFIAAARRAAKVAQTDASVVDMKRTGTDSAVRASLVEQSRDYVARHKRPVLLSIAALFVIVGTMALVQRIGLGGGDVQVADSSPPAPITRVAEPSVAPRVARPSLALSPSALPKGAPALANPIPGSDPIQTGSIPSLPSFAAQGAPAPRPTLPAGLTRMANTGDSAAEYVLGTQYAEGRLVPRDFKAAASWYQKAADQGVVPAQYRLASLYEKGLGVAQDKAKARSLYVRAAEAGNPRAMHNLAVMLAEGDGHPDYDGAATWFRKAAQYGVHDSQYNLAILLARGLGTQQSFIQSYQWFAIAAAQNDTDAAKKRDEVATRLNANDLAVAKALAAAYRPRTADVAATDVPPPPGGWDGAEAPSSLNSPRPKISML